MPLLADTPLVLGLGMVLVLPGTRVKTLSRWVGRRGRVQINEAGRRRRLASTLLLDLFDGPPQKGAIGAQFHGPIKVLLGLRVLV